MLRRLLWLALSVALVHCTADTLPLGAEELDEEPKPGESKRYACLSVAPEVLRFTSRSGEVDEDKSFEIQSRCAWTVRLTNMIITSERGGFYTPGNAMPNLIIDANAVVTVDVRWRGIFDAAKEQGVLQPVFDDVYGEPEHAVALEGVSIDARARLDVDELDLGEVLYEPSAGRRSPSRCVSDVYYVHLFNTGYAPLNVGRVWTDFQDGPFEIAFVEVMGSVVANGQPFAIERGQRAQIAVRYRPWGIEREEDVLRISHDSFEATSEVRLLGRGVPPGIRVEAFVQPTRVVMDILWVIDSSGSMEEEQARLLANLTQFVDYADAIEADYQMAVVEAQAIESGAGNFEECAPHPAVVPASYADRQTRNEAFACLIDVGTDGFATESGLGATRLALELAQRSEDLGINPNQGFLRADADLAVVVVSDEDDQSSLPDQTLLDALYAAKNQEPARVKLHAIAGPLPSGCPYAEGAARYEAATRATDGKFFSICAQDWRPVLTDLGLDVFRPRYQWTLRFPARASSLRVTIDGVDVPRDPRDGWYYDAARRTVVFNGTWIPAAGTTVSIEYDASCSG